MYFFALYSIDTHKLSLIDAGLLDINLNTHSKEF